MSSAVSQSHNETRPTPHERLASVQDFINTTSGLLIRQTICLKQMECIVDPQIVEALKQEIDKTANRNVELLGEQLGALLVESGGRLQIKHPISGLPASFSGIGYSTDDMEYQAMIKLSPSQPLQQWSILDASQLIIGN
jgi:hypothetical protein